VFADDAAINFLDVGEERKKAGRPGALMRQVIHIFKKDIRHHWPEIALSLAIVAVFMAYQPRIWTDRPMQLRFFRGLINFLPVLMILSWVFLIVRLVQGESLVGDRQFWITRPYEWHKLLAAKLLSIQAIARPNRVVLQYDESKVKLGLARGVGNPQRTPMMRLDAVKSKVHLKALNGHCRAHARTAD